MINRRWTTGIVAAFLVLIVSFAQAAVRLPGFFGNDMVLQRERQVPIWGWADPGEKVTVEFSGQKETATADKDGKWMVNLKPMKACCDGKNLIVSGKTLSGIVVGDVWLCSGQSNMEWTQNSTIDAGNEAKTANLPLIRHMKVNHIAVEQPNDDVRSTWQKASPGSVGGFTAVGFYFARKLHKELNIPIGLINSSWGGTRVEPWTTPDGFRMVPELKGIADKVDSCNPLLPQGKERYTKAIAEIKEWIPKAEQALEKKERVPDMPQLPPLGNSHQDPTKLYNGMIHPLVPYAIRGAIWYQGESNGGERDSYFQKKKALIEGWRKLWGYDFPFYTVQLADFTNPCDRPGSGEGWAHLREAQRKTLTLKNTGMAVIIDIGDARDIHPRNKQDVGLRLARWALAKEHGKDVVASGPLYKGMKVEGNKIRLTFDYSDCGLMVGNKEGLVPTAEVKNGKLQRFAIAGEDKNFVWADAVIDGKTVVVSSDKVAKPAAVRYAFCSNPEGSNLYNKEGLPASPFRTDTW